MRCPICGYDNPYNVQRCRYCGESMVNYRKKRTQTDNLIVAIIVFLILVLIVVAGIIIYDKSHYTKGTYGRGGGGGGLPHITSGIEDSEDEESDKDADSDEEADSDDEETNEKDTEEKPQPDEEEEESNDYDERLARKDEFSDVADLIEKYEEKYLNGAENISEILNESAVVFQKWDSLLNDVYQYLKSIMPEYEFAELKEDENDWITEKESALKEARASQDTPEKAEAAYNLVGIQYTKERCYYLISLIN